MTRPDDNANVTFNGKTLFDGAADTSTTVEQTVVKALNSEWIDSSLELIKETYGISFQDDSATVRDIEPHLRAQRRGRARLRRACVQQQGGCHTAPDLSNAGFRFQIGTKANQNIFAAFSDIHANALGVRSDEGKNVSVATRADAKRAMTIFDRSIRKALDQATTIGALASRMAYTQSNLTTAAENVQASESTIRDADMAKEMMNYTKDNVLAEAAQSMLAQANQSSSGVLSLLQ